MVAIAGVLAAATGILWSSVKRQEDREQLRFVGEQYRRAIGSYYELSPGAVKVYPKQLDDLVSDERFAVPKRHLRRLYPNPLTDRNDWSAIVAPEGGVMGVQAKVPGANPSAGGKDRFVYVPVNADRKRRPAS